MAKQLTWKQAIDIVLADSPGPLHYKDITERILSDKLRIKVGATPAATVIAQITNSIKHDKTKSPYIKVAKGTYTLKKKSSRAQTSQSISALEDEDQYDIITSFGMFWRREAMQWKSKPKVLGMQQIGAKPVDFYGQLGIYLLYDGREVIYVGRSTDRPIGRRLYEHTVDRLSARWDRFSWFGLLPVSDAGKLGALSGSYGADKLIPALEAILIEALEPRQNRKRGDDLAAVEYIQSEDPAIKNKLVLETVQQALSGS